MEVTIKVRGCARCGETHEAIVMRPLTNPTLFDNAGDLYGHYGICPTNGQPIYCHLGEQREAPPAATT